MKYTTFFILLLVLGANQLAAQDTESFVSVHGGYETDVFYNAANAVGLEDGNFLFFYDRTDPETGLNTVELDRISADGTVINLIPDEATGEQSAGSITIDANGGVWAIHHVIRYGNDDNFSDLVLARYGFTGAEVSYLINEYRYEYTTPALVESSPGRFSFLVNSSDSHLGVKTPKLVTFDVNSETIVSEIELLDLDINPDYASITVGENGKLLVATSRSVTSEAMIADLEEEQAVAIDFSEAECDLSFNNAPRVLNFLYDADADAFVAVDQCLNVIQVSMTGGVQSIENVDGNLNSGLEFNQRAYLRFTDNDEDEIFVYGAGNRYRLRPVGGNYEVAVVQNIDISNPTTISTQLTNGRFLLNGQSGFINDISIYNEATDQTSGVEYYDDFIEASPFTVNRSLGLGNGEILVGEEINFALQSKILFYNLDGVLLDSITAQPGENYSPRGFGVLPNGDYVTSLLYGFSDPIRIEVVRFNRQVGIIETLYQSEGANFINNFGYVAFQGKDGNFYFNSFQSDSQGEGRRVAGIDPDGNVIFDVLLSLDNWDGSIERPVVDAAGNVYLINDDPVSGSATAFRYYKYDGNSNLAVVVDVLHGYERFEVGSVDLNEAGDKLLVAGEGRTSGGERENLFLVLNPDNGSVLRTEVISDQPSFNLLVQGAFQSGGDDILIAFNEFQGEDAGVTEYNSVTFVAYDETGEYYREVILTSRNNYFLYDLEPTEDTELFLSGQVNIDGARAPQSFVMGIDYDAVVSVEEVDDLAKTAKLSVFPNPAAEQSTVSWDNSVAGRYELELVTSQGRRLRRWQGDLAVGRASLDVDLARLPSGTYLLRLTTEAGLSSQRIVKH